MKGEGGQYYNSHTAWGYCDGKIVYIMKEGIMTRAWKEGNAWYFNGQVERINPGTTSSRVMAPYMGASAGAGANLAAIGLSTAVSPLLGPAKAPVEHHIFTVDMDNGNLY